MPYYIGDRVRVKSLEALTAISENAKDMVPVVDGFRIDGLLFNSRLQIQRRLFQSCRRCREYSSIS